MESIFSFLGKRGSSDATKVYTPRDVERIRSRNENLIVLQNNIVSINFAETQSFTDPSQASMCLVVLASNGIHGALCHLQTDVDVEKIGDGLSKLFPQVGVPICLAGGETDTSDNLLANTTAALKKRGFLVSTDPEHADILGKLIYRQSTLYSNKVMVRNMPYIGQASVRTLTFPSPK
ncbi:MAG: hypothetical protein NUV65_01670 [Candidatus Roizmanbacteria bacterium]|nr:hypothetical protein [Candidatus Roizmanbacteria bacterium]